MSRGVADLIRVGFWAAVKLAFILTLVAIAVSLLSRDEFPMPSARSS